MAKMTDLPANTSKGKWLKLSSLKDADDNSITIRIMGDITDGWECWGADGKSHRFRDLNDVPADFVFRVENGETDRAKPFKAGFCVDRATEKVLAWQFTQATIVKPIVAINNKKGDLEGYDLTITRLESGGKVAYTVFPGDREALSAEGLAAWAAVKDSAVGMDALFHNADPFEPFGG